MATKLPSRHGKRHITTVTLDADQLIELDLHAEAQLSSRSAVIRQAVKLFLIVNRSHVVRDDEPAVAA